MALVLITLARETRVGSPLDFQLKRVSAPNCLRALNRSAKAGRRAARVSEDRRSETFAVFFIRRLLSVWLILETFAVFFLRRLWSVLRIWETFAVYFYWRLLSFLPKLTTFAGKFYGVCGRFCLGLCLRAQVHNPRAARASRTQSRAYLLGRSLSTRQRNHASASASAS